MTVLAGQKTESPMTKTTSERLARDLGRLTVDYWNTPRFAPHPTSSYAVRHYGSAPVSVYPYNLPVAAGMWAKSGGRALSFLDDLYYRVHVKPRVIDFGNLINTEVEDLTIWNATFGFALVQVPSAPSQPGVTVELPANLSMPYFLKPLEEIVGKVTADINGPPTIGSDFTITIGGVAYPVGTVGRRILLWPFPPNWKDPVDDSYVFKSWAIRSANGKVQSGSTWGNRPRRELEYNMLLKRDDAQRAENLLFGWQSRFYGVVCWPDRTNLTTSAAAGTRVINCDTTNRAFAAGGFVVIFENSNSYESAEIESVTAGSVTITSNLKNSWASGLRVFPVFAGQINSQTSGVRPTDGVLQMSAVFTCDPQTTPGNTPVGPATPMYRGEELYLGKLNWVAPLAWSFDSDRQDIDFNTGRVRAFSESGWTPQNKEHNWFFKTRADGQAFRNFLGRREGIANPVYIPTGNTDFTLIADPLMASQHIDVVDNEYQINAAHAARRDIIFFMRDGSYVIKRITGAAAIVGGLRVTLEEVWPATINKANVKRISFLGLYRQVANKSTIRWYTDEIGTATMRLITDRND